MDEAFIPLREIINELSSVNQSFSDATEGVHTYITNIEIETPVELDINVHEKGNIDIGTIPPLYRVETTFRPSFHKLKLIVIQSKT